MIDTLFERYWTFVAIWASALVLSVIFLVLLLIFKDKLVSLSNDISKTRVVRIVLFSVLTILVVFSSIKCFQLISDYSFVQKDDYEVFTGEFVEYTRFVESNEPGYPRGSYPKFRDPNTHDEIVISGSQDYEVGKSYSIYYLPNSMVYIVTPSTNNGE
jgi:hypothetical protein